MGGCLNVQRDYYGLEGTAQTAKLWAARKTVAAGWKKLFFIDVDAPEARPA
jgi:hypothetical protein